MMITSAKIVITLADLSKITWESSDIIEALVVQETHPISTLLPVSVLETRIYDTNSLYQMFGDKELLQERLPIMVYEIINEIEYFIGKYYLDTWESVSEKELELSAVDVIGILETTPFDGRFFATDTPFEIVLRTILEGLEIDYDITVSLKSETVRGWIPPGTAREALQQLCFATGAMVTTSGSTELVFRESYIPYSDEWHEFDIEINSKFVNQPVRKRSVVTGIELISHNYIQSAEQEIIFDDIVSPGTYKVVFEKPYYNVEVIGAGYIPVFLATHNDEIIVTHNNEWIETGGEFEFGPNWVILNVMQEGQVTITGNLWIDNTRVFSFKESGSAPSTRKNELQIKDATLVSNQNANRTLARLKYYYHQLYEHEFTLVPQEGPKYGQEIYGEAIYGWSTVNVNLGQMLSIETVHEAKLRTVIERADINLAGGYLAKMFTAGVEITEEE